VLIVVVSEIPTDDDEPRTVEIGEPGMVDVDDVGRRDAKGLVWAEDETEGEEKDEVVGMIVTSGRVERIELKLEAVPALEDAFESENGIEPLEALWLLEEEAALVGELEPALDVKVEGDTVVRVLAGIVVTTTVRELRVETLFVCIDWVNCSVESGVLLVALGLAVDTKLGDDAVECTVLDVCRPVPEAVQANELADKEPEDVGKDWLLVCWLVVSDEALGAFVVVRCAVITVAGLLRWPVEPTLPTLVRGDAEGEAVIDNSTEVEDARELDEDEFLCRVEAVEAAVLVLLSGGVCVERNVGLTDIVAGALLVEMVLRIVLWLELCDRLVTPETLTVPREVLAVVVCERLAAEPRDDVPDAGEDRVDFCAESSEVTEADVQTVEDDAAPGPSTDVVVMENVERTGEPVRVPTTEDTGDEAWGMEVAFAPDWPEPHVVFWRLCDGIDGADVEPAPVEVEAVDRDVIPPTLLLD